MNRLSIVILFVSSMILGNQSLVYAQVTKWKLEENVPEQPEGLNAQSDYVVVGKRIKDRFEKWLVKGEFEKSTDHETRLQEEGEHTFYTVCVEEIENLGGYFETELQEYDADGEYFTVVAQKRTYERDGNGVKEKTKIVARSQLKIPISKAEQFQRAYNNRPQRTKPTTGTGWVLVNNSFRATKYLLNMVDGGEITNQYELDIPIRAAKSIIYSTKDLKIDHPKLSQIEFDYSAYIEESAKKSEVSQLEVSPQPPGGMVVFMEWISRNYIFPQAAIDAGVTGKILASFVVDKDGSLADIRIIRDLKYGTGEEFVRVLTQSPKWTPGTLNGNPVRVGYTMPMNLALHQ